MLHATTLVVLSRVSYTDSSMFSPGAPTNDTTWSDPNLDIDGKRVSETVTILFSSPSRAMPVPSRMGATVQYWKSDRPQVLIVMEEELELEKSTTSETLPVRL